MLTAHGSWRSISLIAAGIIGTLVLSTSDSLSTSPASPILISQTPLTVALPAHPQIVFAMGNSQSMDGDLSGAIMTGSGALGGAVGTGLAASSSPANYTIPTGFTPPANPGSAGQAPYTVNVAGTLVDNSASRLNVAKAGINAILNSFMEYADFALMDYQTSNMGEYTTWAYYMSADPSGFSFSTTPGTGEIANPCYGADVAQLDAYNQSCAALQANYGTSDIINDPYMVVGASSDDPLINDVVYAQAGYQPPVCTDGVPIPLNPYTTFTLSDYKAGAVIEYYGVQWGMSGYTYACAPGMVPTNAGYVPYAGQIMYAMRGFGYDALAQSPTTGNLIVPMQSSGDAPTPATVAAAIGAFTPLLQPETADPSTAEVKAVAEQSPTAGLVKGAAQYLSSGNPPSTNACAPAQYIVLVTDGLPTKDLAGNNWPPLGTAAASGYGVTAGTPAGDGSFTTNDQAVLDTIAQIQAAAAVGIKTYVIGLGAGVNPANNPYAANTLTWMASAGGTGNYFAANSPSDLSADMQVILARILAAVRSSASATVNTTALNSTSMAFQPSFDTSDVNQDWTGDIKAYPINPGDGSIETSMMAWSAQAQLDAMASGSGWSNRVIATWDPIANAGTPFEWSGGTPAQGIAVSTSLGQELETNTADASGQDALDYLRGDTQLSLAGGGAYRNRTHVLGDIVDSSPVYVGSAIGPYQGASYYTFEAQHPACSPPTVTSNCREPVLYVGANDGMLHAFDALNGHELFAYIPNGVFANLISLTNPYYNELHQFYVDGAPQVGDVQFSDQHWHTVLVSGERGGGNTIFALDVTSPQSITTESSLASNVLWEFSDPANMGLSYSTPAIAPVAAGTTANRLGFAVFFGNGYNSPSETPYLYAVDPESGTSLPGTPINLCAAVAASAPTACDTTQPNGLSSVNVISASGGIGTPATTVYAGDLQGNVWRVDIHDSNSTNWTVTLLFKAKDPSGTAQPITTTPAVSLNPDFPRLAGTMVYVGTGQLLGSTDLSTTQIQTMYGVYDSGSNSMPLARADLVGQPLTESSTVVPGYTLRFVGGGQVSLASHSGWYVDFNVGSPQTDVGERIVSDPRIVGGAVTVISVKPTPYSSTSATIGPTSRAHANLARMTQPHRSQPKLDPEPSASADSVVYQTRAPPLGAGFGNSRMQFGMDAVYHPGQSKARLWSVGFGSNPPPTLVSLAVSPSNPQITVGQTEAFTATGTYSDGSTRNLTSQATWTSSDPSVAPINSTGLASSATVGSTLITASFGGFTDSSTLTVNPVPPPPPPPTLQSITVTPSNPTINVGATQQFKATGYYSDGTSLNITGLVTWSSSATAVGTISAGGLATGVTPGTTTITAMLGAISGYTLLTVQTYVPPPPPTLQSITVTPANPTIYVGATQPYIATAHFSDGTSQNVTASSTWTSGNTTVATISGGGVATGVTIGTSLITATYMAMQGTANLNVILRPTLMTITVTPANVTIYVATNQSYTATGHYSDGSSAILTSGVTWSSSATSVATITAAGVASGLVAGTTTITATDGAVSGFTGLTVVNRPPPPTLLSISVAPANPTIDVGQNQSFTATGHYSDGSTANLTTLATWSSSNISIATIAAGGGATAVALGTTTITAAYSAVSGNTTLTVINTPPPPPPPVCPGGDTSYLMEFNFAGGAFSSAVFNYNGTNAPTTAIIPANGMLLGGVYAAGPVYNSYSAGNYGSGGDIGWITLGNTQTFGFFQVGFHQQRYSWREIR